MRTDKVPRRRRKSFRERERERGIFLDAEGPKIIGEKMNRTPPPRRETREKNCNRRENEFPPGLISGTETERKEWQCKRGERAAERVLCLVCSQK